MINKFSLTPGPASIVWNCNVLTGHLTLDPPTYDCEEITERFLLIFHRRSYKITCYHQQQQISTISNVSSDSLLDFAWVYICAGAKLTPRFRELVVKTQTEDVRKLFWPG